MNEFLKHEAYQNIRFSFGQGNTKQIIQDLKNEKYDLALCSYVENEPDIELVPITQQEPRDDCSSASSFSKKRKH